MDCQFWHERWQQGEIGFHMGRPHPDLLSFFNRLNLEPGDKVLVPMCGKSRDLLWLRDTGIEVLGVEVSELAVQDFLTENDLTARQHRDADFSHYQVGSLELLCGDFFNLNADQVAGVRGVFDRGALVALPPDVRKRYAGLLSRLLPPGSRVLLVSYAYNQDEMAGPPFSVPREEVEVLYGAGFRLEMLAERDALPTHEVLQQRGLTGLIEFCCLLERRAG